MKQVYDSSNSVAIYCQILLKLVHDCLRYTKPKQCRFRYTA